jgi:hypothetical protein
VGVMHRPMTLDLHYFLLIMQFIKVKVKSKNKDYKNNSHVSSYTEAGISVNLGHPQGRAIKSTLNFLGRIPCLSLIGIDL